MCFISVLLPQPEPPRMPKTSPRANLEVDVVEDRDAVVARGHALDPDDRLGAAGCSRVHMSSR